MPSKKFKNHQLELNSNNTSITPLSRKICTAPMLDWTDKHCRYFHRLLSQNAVLYTEMITTGALLHGDLKRLAYNQEEHPLALQLGGNNPHDLARCTLIAEDLGYDEVNLNVGCPSDRVQNAQFGACLMADPGLVAECIAAMQNKVFIPVTVKTRIGIDENDSYHSLKHFVSTVSQAGCKTFIIHARKAWLNGLSPKQNREVPPLRYDVVFQLKQDFPELEIILNGGIKTLQQAENCNNRLDGAMLGREAYHNPFILADVDQRFYQKNTAAVSRNEVILALIPYIQEQMHKGVRLNSISRHILGLFHGQSGAKLWRRYISENAHKPDADEKVILTALEFIET